MWHLKESVVHNGSVLNGLLLYFITKVEGEPWTPWGTATRQQGVIFQDSCCSAMQHVSIDITVLIAQRVYSFNISLDPINSFVPFEGRRWVFGANSTKMDIWGHTLRAQLHSWMAKTFGTVKTSVDLDTALHYLRQSWFYMVLPCFTMFYHLLHLARLSVALHMAFSPEVDALWLVDTDILGAVWVQSCFQVMDPAPLQQAPLHVELQM